MAILFFGLTRSLKDVYRSLKENIFDVLTNNNIEYDDLVIDLDVLATNLKKMRKQYGKTQQQIADIINTSQSSYAHYENARNLMPLCFLYNLSKIYKDISIDKMLGRKKK